jgi:hypothetical protein
MRHGRDRSRPPRARMALTCRNVVAVGTAAWHGVPGGRSRVPVVPALKIWPVIAGQRFSAISSCCRSGPCDDSTKIIRCWRGEWCPAGLGERLAGGDAAGVDQRAERFGNESTITEWRAGQQGQEGTWRRTRKRSADRWPATASCDHARHSAVGTQPGVDLAGHLRSDTGSS